MEAVVAARPAGLIVPKPDGPQDRRALDAHLITLETQAGLPQRSIQLLPVATETPMAVLSLQDYRSPPPRLAAMSWGAEDLSAALGAATNRDEHGEFLVVHKMVRAMVLIAAKAAGVDAIETLHADFRDSAGLERAARSFHFPAVRASPGWLAIHPRPGLEPINAALHARRPPISSMPSKVVAAVRRRSTGVALARRQDALDQPASQAGEDQCTGARWNPWKRSAASDSCINPYQRSVWPDAYGPRRPGVPT